MEDCLKKGWMKWGIDLIDKFGIVKIEDAVTEVKGLIAFGYIGNAAEYLKTKFKAQSVNIEESNGKIFVKVKTKDCDDFINITVTPMGESACFRYEISESTRRQTKVSHKYTTVVDMPIDGKCN